MKEKSRDEKHVSFGDLTAFADTAFRAGQYDRAINMYRAAGRLRTDRKSRAWIHHNVAVCFRRKGHFLDALEEVKEAESLLSGDDLSPLRAEITLTLGNVLADLEDTEAAIKTLQTAGELFRLVGQVPGQRQAMIGVSRTLAEAGRNEEARPILERMLEGPLPSELRSQLLNNLAIICQRAGDINTAEQLLREDLELSLRQANSVMML